MISINLSPGFSILHPESAGDDDKLDELYAQGHLRIIDASVITGEKCLTRNPMVRYSVRIFSDKVLTTPEQKMGVTNEL
jgi:hypothetical protein